MNSEIDVDGSSLDSVDKFCYRGSTLARKSDLNDEIAKRISKAAMNFRLLRKRALENSKLYTKVKICICETCVRAFFVGVLIRDMDHVYKT